MKHTLAALSISVLVVLGGCASVPKANLAGRTIAPEMVQRIVRDNREKVRSLTGSGTITVETPELAQSGSFELFLHKPDSILVNVEGPFGIHVGSVLLTRTDFLFYNSLKNQLVTGAVNAVNLNRIFRINLTFDELLSLFTGGSFLEGDDHAPDSIAVENNQFVLTYRDKAGSRRYWIDPTSLLITRIQHLDLRGILFLEERFENFRALGDASLPRYVRLTQQLSRRVVAVSFSSFAINDGGVPLMLDVPTNAERVRWQ
jgi:outer membrane lipoprotein-sorting protein